MIRVLKYEWQKYSFSKRRILLSIFMLLYFVSLPFFTGIIERNDWESEVKQLENEKTLYIYYVEELTKEKDDLVNEEITRDLQTFEEINKCINALITDIKLNDGYVSTKDYLEYIKLNKAIDESTFERHDRSKSISELNVSESILTQSIDNGALSFNISPHSINTTNYIYLACSGIFPLIILILIILNNFELYSSEFENGTYKTIYTLDIKKKYIVLGKLLFSFMQSYLILFIGLLLGYVSTLLFNNSNAAIEFLPTNEKVGFAFYSPLAKAASSLSSINFDALLQLVTLVSLVIVITCFVSYLSKSAGVTISILLIIIMVMITVQTVPVSPILISIFPWMVYNIEYAINGPYYYSTLYLLLYTFLSSSILLVFLLYRTNRLDMSGGEDND